MQPSYLSLDIGALHHVRRRLPVELRVVTVDHPLTGRLLRARRVYRQWGRLWLVVELPDGGVGSVEVADTDVLAAEPIVTAPSGFAWPAKLPALPGRKLVERREGSCSPPARQPSPCGRCARARPGTSSSCILGDRVSALVVVASQR